MQRALDIILHLSLLLVLPPLLLGVVNRTKALWSGRRGQPLLQLYYDLAKLSRKGLVLGSVTTPVFWLGPILSVATVVLAALLLPFGQHAPVVSFSGDLILFCYLLALARFFVAAAALDTGSAFEGMGAAREVTLASLAEPALFFGLLVLAKTSGGRSLQALLSDPWAGIDVRGTSAALVLIAASWLVVLLAETCRVPFDDPNTHLELTMIHEVMVLDHSGPLFCLVQYGAALKLFVLSALLTRLVAPVTVHHALGDWALFAVVVLAFGGVVGTIESVAARLRLVRVPQLLVSACLLSAFGLILVAR